MNDDWSPPTAEHDRAAIQRKEERAQTPPPDEIDPVLGVSERDLNVLNAYYHHQAVEASQSDAPLTAAEEVQLDAIRAHNDRLLAMTPEEMLAERARRASLQR